MTRRRRLRRRLVWAGVLVGLVLLLVAVSALRIGMWLSGLPARAVHHGRVTTRKEGTTMRHIRHRGAVLAIVTVACLAAGAAYAAIPDGNGVIHACYNSGSNPSGQLRVIDTAGGGKCSKNEKALDFNQTGPRGPVGPQGATGATGTQGQAGVAGAAGPAGPTGAQGVAGPAGPAGPPGAQGAPGAAGISTATFGFGGETEVEGDDTLTKVASKNLGAGAWAIVATVNSSSYFPFGGDGVNADFGCQLRNGSDVIGSATDRRLIPNVDNVKRSLTMNGGALIGAAGGEVSVWCFSQVGGKVDGTQMMLLQVGGFS